MLNSINNLDLQSLERNLYDAMQTHYANVDLRYVTLKAYLIIFCLQVELAFILL